jgi:TPR repeat protein
MTVRAQHPRRDLIHGIAIIYDRLPKLYRKVAGYGFAMAEVSLALVYENGCGVPQSYTEAARWYRKAADKGLATAQYNLGHLYYAGQGVPLDYLQAQMWWILAAARGDKEAAKNRDRLCAWMTPAQIAQALALAAAWKPTTGKSRAV